MNAAGRALRKRGISGQGQQRQNCETNYGKTRHAGASTLAAIANNDFHSSPHEL
jgi:hypothetical protein